MQSYDQIVIANLDHGLLSSKERAGFQAVDPAGVVAMHSSDISISLT